MTQLTLEMPDEVFASLHKDPAGNRLAPSP
jgi:hypothetical protein